jgi:hypothetical protein
MAIKDALLPLATFPEPTTRAAVEREFILGVATDRSFYDPPTWVLLSH